MTFSPFPTLVEITRGPVVESIHAGVIAVVDSHGRLLSSIGDPYTVTYLRSSSKPIQVLPFVEAGGVEKYSISERELALMCASHSGTDEHYEVVSGLQARLGLREEMLLCGTHNPFHEPTAQALMQRGEKPTQNRHNCSGKHTGFLAYCMLRGLPTDEYINPAHPIQQSILQAFAEMSSTPKDEIAVGIDGCSAPVFAVPLYNAALAFARLANPSKLVPERASAVRKITHAMSRYPNMVAGPGRFDTLVMELGQGKLVTKMGAEGYQGMAILPGALGPHSPGIGITIKIADGDLKERAIPLVAIEVLRQLGFLSQEQIGQMNKLAARPVPNWQKIAVGEMRPTFRLPGLPLEG